MVTVFGWPHRSIHAGKLLELRKARETQRMARDFTRFSQLSRPTFPSILISISKKGNHMHGNRLAYFIPYFIPEFSMSIL